MFRSNLAQNGGTLPSGYRSREGKRFQAMHRNRPRSFCPQLFASSGVGLIGSLVLPQTQQENAKFARHGHDRPLLGPGSAIGRQPQSVFTQSALRAKWSQNVLRGTNQQPAQVSIPALGDAQLRIAPSALIAPRT